MEKTVGRNNIIIFYSQRVKRNNHLRKEELKIHNLIKAKSKPKNHLTEIPLLYQSQIFLSPIPPVQLAASRLLRGTDNEEFSLDSSVRIIF